MKTPINSVDVVIPVYRPGEKCRALFKMLSGQSIRPGKVILMVTKDPGEDFFPEELLPSDASSLFEIHELEKKDFNHGRTRNQGAGYSSAEAVVFMTDDAVPADLDLIENLLAGLSEEKTAVCYARQLPAADAELAECFSREFNYPAQSRLKTKADLPAMGIKAFFCSNVCAAYNRAIFDRLGGFVDQTVFNEDMIFARRALEAGYGIKYQAEARVVHSHDLSNTEQYRRSVLLARSQKEHPEIFGDVSSESEGIRYIKEAFGYFRQKGKGYLILPFLVTCGFRFFGYRVGKRRTIG
ncbi:MAG: glycosyltransferase, partial [Lachnospiraceae bacterium]|nr:glycosyltransferase [Lachnospiraceae bacterium]